MVVLYSHVYMLVEYWLLCTCIIINFFQNSQIPFSKLVFLHELQLQGYD